jgi:Holliday junction resolvasome RuvABC endonuclease subunit
MTAVLGIDPGLSGALAIIDGSLVEAYAMPETRRDLLDLVFQLKDQHGVEFALLEEITALPAAVEEKLGIKRGSIATMKLARNFGQVEMALTAADIPHDELVPRSWKKIVGVRPGGDQKKIGYARAQQLFPTVRLTHQVADALLIAKACQILQAQQKGQRIELPPAPEPPPQPIEEDNLFARA